MFTVRDFLEEKFVPWHRLLAGGVLLESRPIEHAASLELPIEHFARENDLVLSTIVGCEQEEAFLELVRDVHMAGASALLVTRPEDAVTLPPAVLRYLEDHPFPVILIPWHIRFADIIEAVSRRIQADTHREIARYERLQKRLLEGYLSSMNLNQAAQLLSDSFSSHVLIFDGSGGCRGSSRTIAPRSRQELAALSAGQGCLIEITTHERLYGSLYLQPFTAKKDFDEALFYHYLIWPLILWFDKEWAMQSASQRVKDDFIWRLTKGAGVVGSFESLCQEGQRLGFQLQGSYLCITGAIYLCSSADMKADEQWIAANINLLKEEILQTAEQLHRRIMVTYQKKLLIVYLQAASPNPQPDVDLFLDQLEHRASQVFPRVRFTWGISGPGGNPTDFRACFQHALQAQELCVNLPGKSTRFTFQNTLIDSILSRLSSDRDIQERVKAIIAPLVNYDLDTGSSLLKTLQCYLSCKNLSEAARLLHLHRQSLLYRINKIEELTGLSLKNADHFFLLELCVRLGLR